MHLTLDVKQLSRCWVLLFVLPVWLSLSALAQNLPANASPMPGGGWYCNLGYTQVGNRCERTNLPANASPMPGGGWYCNMGHKRSGSRCVEMTAAEKRQQLERLAAARARSRSENLEGLDFSLADVERRCEAYVYDREYGELECRYGLREAERKCEVYISSWPDGEIECRGSELRPVERYCSVRMYSSRYGDVDC